MPSLKTVGLMCVSGVAIVVLVTCFFMYAEDRAHARDYMDDPI